MIKTEVDDLADRISDQLSPIHRGAIRIGRTMIAAFGNDGYAADKGVRQTAAVVARWMRNRGWWVSEIGTSDDGHTWAVVAVQNDGRLDNDVFVQVWQMRAHHIVWKAWQRVKDVAGGYQRELADRELDTIGGGYTDATLSTAFRGKGARIRGDRLTGDLMIVSAEGNEDVHIVLGGVPYPAKILTIPVAPPPDGCEVAILLEDIGDPRLTSADPATAFFSRGLPIVVRDSGEQHPSTGRRMLVPVEWHPHNPIPG
jgi:hypothetical protein